MAEPEGGGSVKSPLLDEADAAEAPYPCGRCGDFHGNESGYCSACSAGWLNSAVAAKTGRLQRRSYLALVTLVMSYFETSDRLVLSVFVGSTALIVFFWFLTKSIATAEPAWIAALVLYVVAVLYLIPTIRGTVVTIEDVDKISKLFDAATKTCLEGVEDADAGPEPQAREDEQLVQSTSELRRLYVLARVRLASFEVEVVERLARAGRAPTEPSRETKTSQLKKLFRAREKVAVDYGGRGERLRDVLRASIVCETVAELKTLGDELRALEAAGTVKVLQIKNRFRGHPTPSGYRDVNVSLLYHGFIAELQIHLRAILSIAERQHVAYQYAREMDLMGVLEPPVENTTCTASVRRQGVTYLVARMVPAALSVVIGWLYVDAFVLKGANLIVKRADLLPTRGFSPPYVLLRVYGLILAAPYWANAYLLCRAAGFFGEKARQQRHEKTRVAMLYERYFGYDGTLFVWKIFCFQIFEVALQSYGKVPLFLIWSSPFDCLRATCTKSFGKAMSEGRSASFLHAFVIFFFSALLVNVLYPTFLLRSRHVFYQRNFSFIADTVLDVIYALVPFVFLALGVRSQPMIIPHDPIEYTSNLFPMLHAHFVISVLESAAEERRALRKVAVATASGASEKLPNDEEGAAAAPGAAGDEAVSARKYASQLYVALVVACVASWCVAFCAIGLELQITTTAFFFVTSLALPLAARAAGRPSFSTWLPALGLGPVYIAIFWAGASPVFLSFALVAHGALVLFSAPETDTGPQTRAAAAAGHGRLPRWGAAAYFVITAGCVIGSTMLYLSGNAVFSTCQPCECDAKGVLLNCDVFAEAESLTLVDGLNVNAFVEELYLSNKGITEIRPGAFKGLPNLEKLYLKNNKIDGLGPRTFEGLHSIREIDLQRNAIRSKPKVKCGAFDRARRDGAGIHVRVERDRYELFCSEYRHISHITPCSCYGIPDQCTTVTDEQLDSYYVPEGIELSWNDAKKYCESPWVRASGSAHLVTIRSQADLDAMNELMGCRDFWIGYDRQGGDGSWKWSSGDATTFSEWYKRPGASQGFDCAYQSTLGQWHATFCDMEVRHPFVCELAQSSAWTWPTAAPTTMVPSVSPKPTMDLDLPLALAIDGTKDTFNYDGPLWTNDKLLDEDGESKTDAFFTPSTTFTVVMRTGSEERTLLVELNHPKSLKELFSGGYTKTSASLDEWRGLVPNAGYQPRCNRQGFNVAADGCYVDDASDYRCRLRLGIWFNEQDNCMSSDSFLGLGATKWSSGAVCEYADEGQCRNVPSFTRIYVGGVTAPPTFSPEPSRAPTTAAPTSSMAPTSSLLVETITCGETRTGSTVHEAHWLSGNDAPDHFYLITPSETAYYHFSTCGSSFDTMLYLYQVQDSSTLDTCLRAPAPGAGHANVLGTWNDKGWETCVFKSPSSSREFENVWTSGPLEEGETYVLQVTGYLDQDCWEDNERGASAAGDYVLSMECADEPVDEWCADFDWCEDKELGEEGTGFCNEWGNDLDGYCETDEDCEAKSSCYADCAATPGCDQPLLMCDEGVCHSYILDARCDGQDDDFDLGDGYSCMSDDEGTGWRNAHCSMFARMDPPDYSSLDLSFRARDCYDYTEGPHMEYLTEMFLPASTPEDCLNQCAGMTWSKAAIISGDGSLCECVGGEVQKCYLRPVGTPHTIDALTGSKTVCYTRDVDLGGVEYQDTCTSDNPCEGRCQSGFYTMQCLDNGHVWHGERCDSCDNSGCDPYDITVAMGGTLRCNPATDSWGWDNDLDGTIDECEGTWSCGYHESCQGVTDGRGGSCELSGDITSSLSGTTNHGNAGWCYSDLDQDMGCAASPVDCWNICIDEFGDALVAIDWWEEDGWCFCQDDCQCVSDAGWDGYIIARDSAVAALPNACDSSGYYYYGDDDASGGC